VESDDLLAAEAAALARQGHDVLIVSSDKDFAQLVGDRIQILLPPPSANPRLGWRRLDAAAVRERFGVPPGQIADYLALVGDTSDNIPGLDGVGPKTAARWLERFGSLDGVLAHAGEAEPERFRLALAAAADRLRLNLRLTTLNLEVTAPSAERGAARPEELFSLLEAMEMRTALGEARRRYQEPELF
jgi:DNA polymerase-1